MIRLLGALPALLIGILVAIGISWQICKNGTALLPTGSNPTSYIPTGVVVLSLLVSAFSYDRLFLSKDLEERLDALTEIINTLTSRSISASQLEGSDQIYESRAYLWSKMQVRARTVLVGGPKAHDVLINAISNRLAYHKNSNHDVRFEVALIVDSSNFDLDGIKKQNDSRFERFKRQGVDRFVEVKVVESSNPLNFDVLIIDEQHVNIGFPTFCRTNTIMSGLAFENQPTIARNLASWFDSCVYPQGIPFEQWYNRRMAKNESTQPA